MKFFSKVKIWFENLFRPKQKKVISQKVKFIPSIKRKEKVKKNINVGIDFGTSSTKVLYRDVTENKGSFLDIYEDLTTLGYASFCMPSTVTVLGGMVFFSSLAEKESDRGIVFRSFKICFVCGVKDTFGCGGRKETIRRFCEEDQRCKGTRGFFGLLGECGENFGLTAEEITAFYLAYIIKIVREKINIRYKNAYDLTYTYNICAPMDQYSDQDICKQYEKMFFLAEKLSFSIENGIALNFLKDSYRNLRLEYEYIPDEDVRSTFVLPETLASVMAHINSRRAEEGLYSIVDIGAGTTDISFFRYSSAVENIEGIYAAKTTLSGMDDFDAGIFRHVVDLFLKSTLLSASKKINLLQKIRIAKQKNENNIYIDYDDGAGANINREDLSAIANPLKINMKQNNKKVWAEAYAKEKRESRWEKVLLYIIGGGSKNTFISEAFTERPHTIVKRIDTRRVDISDGIFSLTELPKEDEDSAFMLPVAHGLSFHKIDWGKQILSFQIESLVPMRRREFRDPDDGW